MSFLWKLINKKNMSKGMKDKMKKGTAVKKSTSVAIKKQLLKQNSAMKQLVQIGKDLEYREHSGGSLHLFVKSTDTGIIIKRSHEGYSHFACWYVIDNGKIKKNFPINEEESARVKGISIYLEKLTNDILKTQGGGK